MITGNSSRIFVLSGAKEMKVVGLRKVSFLLKMEEIAAFLHVKENDLIEKISDVREDITYRRQGTFL